MWIRRIVAIVAAVSALSLLVVGAASAATAIEYGLLGQQSVVVTTQ